jgi:membrane protein implicated in regulation of membrane protease activity
LLLTMADSEIPKKLLPAIRLAVFWISLPFIGLLLGGEDLRSHNYDWAVGWFACALLSILVAVYWDRLLPQRLRTPPGLRYLRTKDSELGSAMRDMVVRSAWGRWFAAQVLVNSGVPATEQNVLQIASHNVLEKLVDGDLVVRGRLPGNMEYQVIPREHWRSSALHFVQDPRMLWRMIIIPRGGAEISPDGTVTARDATAQQRTAALLAYDSLIVDAYEFENLWPRRERLADKKRRKLLLKARWRGLDTQEIKRLC